jgi:hypothetical protein
VDDATKEGEIWFDNGMIYPRTASAHRMLDYANVNQLADHRVWLPFHFFPGNDGQERPTEPPAALDREAFYRRCICRPNSAPARDLMRMAVERQNRPYALQQLGIATHVFVDTWAHQGFVGYQHHANAARDIHAAGDHDPEAFFSDLKHLFRVLEESELSTVIGWTLPLGHGAALTYPDMPYLVWSYTNGVGERIERDNPHDFFEAAQEVLQWFLRYRRYADVGEAVFSQREPLPAAFEVIRKNLVEIRLPEGRDRHAAWLALIQEGAFGFAGTDVPYVDKGPGSWKARALGREDDVGDTRHDPVAWTPGFASSKWKHFHDALLAHRFHVLHEILPRYGLLSG